MTTKLRRARRTRTKRAAPSLSLLPAYADATADAHSPAITTRRSWIVELSLFATGDKRMAGVKVGVMADTEAEAMERGRAMGDKRFPLWRVEADCARCCEM